MGTLVRSHGNLSSQYTLCITVQRASPSVPGWGEGVQNQPSFVCPVFVVSSSFLIVCYHRRGRQQEVQWIVQFQHSVSLTLQCHGLCDQYLLHCHCVVYCTVTVHLASQPHIYITCVPLVVSTPSSWERVVLEYQLQTGLKTLPTFRPDALAFFRGR